MENNTSMYTELRISTKQTLELLEMLKPKPLTIFQKFVRLFKKPKPDDEMTRAIRNIATYQIEKALKGE